jgi:hypothetical protein
VSLRPGPIAAMFMPDPVLKQRHGDQPLPIPNGEPDIQSMVIADIGRRREVGIERYGTALQAHNGRDTLRDAYEEALDLAMYLRQAIEERDHPVTGAPGVRDAARAARGGDTPAPVQGYA